MSKTIQTVLGFLLIAIGAFVWIKLPERGELPAVAVMLTGANMISQSAILQAAKSFGEVMRAWRARPE